jgi:adenosylhomocysteine nucleosidase
MPLIPQSFNLLQRDHWKDVKEIRDFFSISKQPMKADTPPKTFIYTALPCEAKPLIDFYRLKKDTAIHSFDVYTNKALCLTVTGIGKNAMAAAVAYTLAIFSSAKNPVMLNVGIAGHKNHPIGSVYLVDKITDGDSGRRHFPPLVFTPPCPTHSLKTVARPQLIYPERDLCDMESSAFYETAIRFSSGELIQCLKIVSDNETSPARNMQPKWVTELIDAQLETIAAILKELTRLAALLTKTELSELTDLLSRHHFTENEQMQLKKLLHRWHLVTDEKLPKNAELSTQSGKEFLKGLKQQLSVAKFYL